MGNSQPVRKTQMQSLYTYNDHNMKLAKLKEQAKALQTKSNEIKRTLLQTKQSYIPSKLNKTCSPASKDICNYPLVSDKFTKVSSDHLEAALVMAANTDKIKHLFTPTIQSIGNKTIATINARLESYAQLHMGKDFDGAFQEMCSELVDILNGVSNEAKLLSEYQRKLVVAYIVYIYRQYYGGGDPKARLVKLAANLWTIYRHKYLAGPGGDKQVIGCGSDAFVRYKLIKGTCTFAESPYGEGVGTRSTPCTAVTDKNGNPIHGRYDAFPMLPGGD
jgi:hypothetical protein